MRSIRTAEQLVSVVSKSSDTVVVGGGLIGLCTAAALAKRGLTATLVSEPRPGQASSAAAGMLAPSVERASGPAHDFAIAARDMYPEYLEWLAEAIGIRVPLNRLGILQVALTERGIRGLQKTRSSESQWLDRREVAELEATLSQAMGAVMNPDDGAVDNVILVNALTELVDVLPAIERVSGAVTKVSEENGTAAVTLDAGKILSASHVVIAAGAWGGMIEGATPLAPVSPSRGQLVSYQSIGLRHVTYGPRGYLVPRASGTTIAGSTMENVGFNSDTTPSGLDKVRSAAEEIAPGLSIARVTAEWAGLRPVTPDTLPIIGPDTERPSILYACGHSRNGILMGPLTGETIAGIIAGETPTYDLSQFRPGRF